MLCRTPQSSPVAFFMASPVASSDLRPISGLPPMQPRFRVNGLLLLALLLGIITAPSAHAATIYVNGQMKTSGAGASWTQAKRTIGEAIDQATSGTQIWIANGTYHESLIMKGGMALYGGFQGKETRLSERNPITHPTIIDAGQIAKQEKIAVVTIWNVKNICLDGIIIKGGSDGGIACLAVDDTLTIRNCVILGNSAESGGGISILYNQFPRVSDCVITSNTATYGGGLDYRIHPNKPASFLDNCKIVGNVADITGGGINVEYGNDLLIRNCIFNRNKTLRDYSVDGTGFSGVGGGITCAYSSLKVINCTISQNIAGGGGGIFCDYESNPLIINTILDRNTHHAVFEAMSWYYNGDSPGSVLSQSASKIKMDEGVFYSYADSDASLRNCLFYGNPDGDFFDEAATSYSGIKNIEAHVPEVRASVEGDPRYVMGARGKWTATPVYDAASDRTTLFDTAANFTPGKLAGQLIAIDVGRTATGYILENQQHTLVVLGNLRNAGAKGGTYQVLDWHLPKDSPAVDRGTSYLAIGRDIEGNLRPIDTPMQGAERTGKEYDIGAYEVQVRRNAMEGEWELYR